MASDVDLRELLIAADSFYDDTVGAQVVRCEDVPAVVAAWLRDKAAEMRTRIIYRRGLPEELERIADEIHPLNGDTT